MNPKKDKLLVFQMYDALRLNKYCVLCHKQQRGKYFDEVNKVTQAPLQYLFDVNKFCGAW